MRVLVLAGVVMYSCAALVVTAPLMFAQRGSNERELADYGARIRQMEQWQRDREAFQLPAKVMSLEQSTRRIEEQLEGNTRLNWATLMGITIWAIQQLFQLLMKRGKSD